MQENFTDNQLVDFINNGEYKYLQLLINRYMPYIINIASRYKVGGLDAEDFIQEGLMAIFSAVKVYNPQKASFKTFACLCINRAMSAAIARVAGNAKHVPDGLISPIDEVELTDMSDPESIFIEKESFNDLEDSIRHNLSDFEYKVLVEFLNGNSYAEIALALDVTVKSIDNALRRIRSKIKH